MVNRWTRCKKNVKQEDCGVKTRMKILIYSQNWGFARGVAYHARNHVKSLLDLGYEVTVLCFGGMDREEPEFDLPIKKIYTNDFWEVPGDFFKSILDEVKPDYCLFYEYDQWKENPDDLIDICIDNGVKPIGAWIAWERMFNYMVPNFKKFHKIFTHTESQVKLFRKFGLTNTYFIPYGFDLTEWEGEHKEIDDKVVFLHTSGFGGVRDRRNTDVVLEAYELIKDENTKLIVTNQKIQTIPYNEIKELYRKADCYLCPSKWEGLGLPNIESIISGTPVITTHYPPMNEIVKENKTGLLVKACDYVETKDIGVAQQTIDPRDLAEKMKLIKDKEIRSILFKGCKEEKENFNIKKMSEAFKKELE